MIDISQWTGNLRAEWQVTLLDRATLRPVPGGMIQDGTHTGVGVVDGQLTYDAGRQIQDSGQISLRLPSGRLRDIAWPSVRVRVSISRDGTDPIPLGIFLASVSGVTSTGTGYATATVDLHGLTVQLAQQRITETLTVPAGADPVAVVTQLLAAAGHTRVAVTPTARRLGSAITWDPGTDTTILRVINDLLDAAGYFAVSADAAGNFLVTPYVAPGSRTPVCTLHPGIMTAEWTHDADDFGTPNRILVVQKVEGSAVPLVTTVSDQDSKYGYAAVGRWIDAEPITADGQTMDLLRAAGMRRLAGYQLRTEAVSVTVPFIPVREHDAVNLAVPDQTAGIYTVMSRKIGLTTEKIVELTLRRTVR